MTRLELMQKNKKDYLELAFRIEAMEDGLEKVVATYVTLAWIKGERAWLGGLGCGKYSERAFASAVACGYTFDEVYDEFNRQMHTYTDSEKEVLV